MAAALPDSGNDHGVSAAGDVVSLDGVRPCDHLIAWDQYPDRQSTLQWRLVPNEELPDTALDRDFVEELFAWVSLPPDQSSARYRRGVSPVVRWKSTEKWLQLEQPTLCAISVIGKSEWRKRLFARSTRRSRTYR